MKDAVAALPSGVKRLLAIVEDASPVISAAAIADAADALLADRSLGLKAAERQRIVARLRALVEDPKVPDAVAVRAFRLIKGATARKPGGPSS